MIDAELERWLSRLRDRWEDSEAWLVFADYLQARSDPRGEVILLEHLSGGASTERRRLELLARVRELRASHPELWPPELEGRLRFWRSRERWQWGFLRRLRIVADVDRYDFGPDRRELLRLLGSGCAVLLERLSIEVRRRQVERHGALYHPMLGGELSPEELDEGELTEFGDELAEALAHCPNLRFLKDLRLDNAFVSEQGKAALRRSTALKGCVLDVRLSLVDE